MILKNIDDTFKHHPLHPRRRFKESTTRRYCMRTISDITNLISRYVAELSRSECCELNENRRRDEKCRRAHVRRVPPGNRWIPSIMEAARVGQAGSRPPCVAHAHACRIPATCHSRLFRRS